MLEDFIEIENMILRKDDILLVEKKEIFPVLINNESNIKKLPVYYIDITTKSNIGPITMEFKNKENFILAFDTIKEQLKR